LLFFLQTTIHKKVRKLTQPLVSESDDRTEQPHKLVVILTSSQATRPWYWAPASLVHPASFTLPNGYNRKLRLAFGCLVFRKC